MNFKLIGFALYITLLIPTIFYIGNACYNNGKVYVLAIFSGNQALSLQTNKLLLICYYLLNIGYVFYSLVGWKIINNFGVLFGYVMYKIALIVLLLGTIHYLNILGILIYAYFNNLLFNKKNNTL